MNIIKTETESKQETKTGIEILIIFGHKILQHCHSDPHNVEELIYYMSHYTFNEREAAANSFQLLHWY